MFNKLPKSESLHFLIWLFFEDGPRNAVVLLAVGFVEGGVVFDDAFGGAAGEGVVQESFGDGAFLQVADVFPAEGDFLLTAGWGVDAVAGAFF